MTGAPVDLRNDRIRVVAAIQLNDDGIVLLVLRFQDDAIAPVGII